MVNNHSVLSGQGCLCFILWMFSVYLIPVPGLDPLERCDPGPCRAGQFHNLTSNSCVPCPDGTFIDQDNHSCENCKSCRMANIYDEEVVLVNCTTTQDTQLVCIDGYFAQSDTDLTDLECLPCTQCEEMKKQCTTNSDTVCEDARRNSSDMVQSNRDVVAEVTTERNLIGNISSQNTIIIVGVVVGAVILLLIITFVTFRKWRSKKIPTFSSISTCINRDTSHICLASNDEMEMQPSESTNDKADSRCMAEMENTSV